MTNVARRSNILVQVGNHFAGESKTIVWDSSSEEVHQNGRDYASEYAEWDNGDFGRVLVLGCEEPWNGELSW